METSVEERSAALWPARPLEGRVALITGCGRANGIGGGIARVMAAAGAYVVVADVDPAGAPGLYLEQMRPGHESYGLTGLTSDIRAAGGAADQVTGDVTSESDAERMVAQARERFGQVDILVNTAAAPHGREYGEIENVPVADWDRVIAVAGRGMFLMCRAAVPGMRDRRWGRIINISSVAGKAGRRRNFVYSASKAAVLGFTRSLALDLAPHGITVNAICPGPIDTTRLRTQAVRSGRADVEAFLTERGQALPVGRLGKPEDVGAVAAFLATDMASFVTARDISVDGGEEPS
jgi:3-oxoacyl-[acyl-carrier protein] reductase